MARPALLSVAVVAVLAAAEPMVFAHGGTFRPPVTPPAPPTRPSPGGQYHGPQDTTPPEGGPGPTTGPGTPAPTGPQTGPGGPKGPVTPTGGGRGPATPGGAVVPGGPTGGGPMTGGGRKRRGVEGPAGWQVWWEMNRDPYLALRTRFEHEAPTTGRNGFLAGAGRALAPPRARGPSDDDIESVVLPALRKALLVDDGEIQDSAVLALARVARDGDAAALIPDLQRVLRSRHGSARQSAVLALGVLGARDALPALLHLAQDTAQGRELLDAGGVPVLDRAYAAIGLGMSGDPMALRALFQLVRTARSADREIACAAVTALGLVVADRQSVVLRLCELLDDARLDPIVRAEVPIALGRLGADAEPTVPALTRLIADRRTPDDVRCSAIIALGLLAPPGFEDVEAVLISSARKDADADARHFALMALARIGERAAQNQNTATTLRVGRLLREELSRATRVDNRPFAALALGLVGRALPEGATDRAAWSDQLGACFDDTGDPALRPAYAVALGLMGASARAGALRKAFTDSRVGSERGQLAVALGLLGDQGSVDILRAAAIAENDGAVRLELSIGLGLLGDASAVEPLIASLREARTLSETMSSARALGLLGDRAAIPALADLVNDEQAPGLSRAFCCVALGLIGERTALRWNAPLAVDSNYLLPLQVQREILDIL